MRVFDDWSKESDGIATAVYRPAKPSELAKVHPQADVAKSKGGKLHSWNGAEAWLQWDDKGFVVLTVNGQKAQVHKDEFMFLMRAAKGQLSM